MDLGSCDTGDGLCKPGPRDTVIDPDEFGLPATPLAFGLAIDFEVEQ